MPSILITQCLQNDFVKPLEKYEPLPNKLHIGNREAERLIGIRPEDGPVCRLVNWAYQQPQEKLKIIHIRDWHDSSDTKQQKHLIQFGNHCIQHTDGAQFVFHNYIQNNHHHLINSKGLNDFMNTNLEVILNKYQDQEIHIGLIGVWTEAKISFLVYELASRYPKFRIAICSALTASSSTAMHYIALERLKNLFGITIYSSIADFTSFLTGTIPNYNINNLYSGPNISLPESANISPIDKNLLQYLFRESKEVEFKVLDGGFSGNLVLKSLSTDIHGHKQAPTVIKIGNRNLIAKERDAFEKIKDVLGNNAPSIIDSAEENTKGAIKYRYAAMYGEKTTTFQSFYKRNYNKKEIRQYLDIIFTEQLGKLYDAKKTEKLNLLDYYEFSSKYHSHIKENIETILGTTVDESSLTIEGISCYNVYHFYKNEIDNILDSVNEQHFMSYIHGDLNGANIIIDGQKNIWLIDFFHTHYGHVLKDLIKLENDILFIFTEIRNKQEFIEASGLIKHIMSVSDLAKPPKPIRFTSEPLNHAFDTIRHLRTYYAKLIDSVRDPFQYHVAMLRYSMHSITFDECNIWQKKLALLTASQCAEQILMKLTQSKKLRLDYLKVPDSIIGTDKIALTLLPGRKDMQRDLNKDLQVIKEAQINNILTLITEEEMAKHGVPTLISDIKKTGINSYHIPIKDQGIPSSKEIIRINQLIDDILNRNEKILIHCVGGLGRTGTIAALYLIEKTNSDYQKAIKTVRSCRSQRAIESKAQIELIEKFAIVTT